ncbi:phosphate ABC transporter permease subunit PstC [Desulfallas thermosapovorans]|uniref:Phosphate transport system permease protein n=1 Tax=Desulfallas thermosapovorans DSM 6562 TaxID=1121431 RepID=A0A5S4ZQX4_9FIRM|nr:phosphate ABC transporter permease subunit PstC [Desulfallas thermosapovorans]TYO95312.1 phosphate ABC transporter membrane protein 1, PhoT family (TC 3.A.1.7.1) [Desulfallas thermosapovorans DSM 6562]
MSSRHFVDRVGRGFTLFCLALVFLLTITVIYVFVSKGLAIFFINGISPAEFIFSSRWWPGRPVEEGGPLVGAGAFITGSLLVSMPAVAVSAPLGIMVAVFIVEIAPEWGRQVLQSAVDMLAAIPAVVYGYVGLVWLVPLIDRHLGGGGLSLLAGFLVLSVMILPTIISVSTAGLRVLPLELKHASYALGSTRWQTIRMVLLPAARSSLVTAVVLGMARAFGEALAVQMVIGNTREWPTSILSPVTTLTSVITMDMGMSVTGTAWNNALWTMGLLLLLMSLGHILVIRLVMRKEAVR